MGGSPARQRKARLGSYRLLAALSPAGLWCLEALQLTSLGCDA